jgi:hypothetical protein
MPNSAWFPIRIGHFDVNFRRENVQTGLELVRLGLEVMPVDRS